MFDDGRPVYTHGIILILYNNKIKFMMILFMHEVYNLIHVWVMNHRQTFNTCLLVQYEPFRTDLPTYMQIFLNIHYFSYTNLSGLYSPFRC